MQNPPEIKLKLNFSLQVFGNRILLLDVHNGRSHSAALAQEINAQWATQWALTIGVLKIPLNILLIIIQKMHNMEKQHLKCYFNAILHLLETSMIMWSLNYLKGVVETPNFSWAEPNLN